MGYAAENLPQESHADTYPGSTTRIAAKASEPDVLCDIYKQDVNIAIWQRKLDKALTDSVTQLLESKPSLQFSASFKPSDALRILVKELKHDCALPLAEDIAELVDMFCCLFDLKRTGLRLACLDKAMCPRFHVDRVPCRLVTTYSGLASEWLAHKDVNRNRLGHRAEGLSDNESGLYNAAAKIQRLNTGDVALLKGESWEGNENAGLVHRSPSLCHDERRLLLPLDFSS